MAKNERLFTAKDAARLIGISAALLRLRVRNGKAKHVRRGDGPKARVLIPEGEVKRLQRIYQPAAS